VNCTVLCTARPTKRHCKMKQPLRVNQWIFVEGAKGFCGGFFPSPSLFSLPFLLYLFPFTNPSLFLCFLTPLHLCLSCAFPPPFLPFSTPACHKQGGTQIQLWVKRVLYTFPAAFLRYFSLENMFMMF